MAEVVPRELEEREELNERQEFYLPLASPNSTSILDFSDPMQKFY